MNWLLFYEIIYVVVLVLVCLRIIYDTTTSIKALAYLLLVIFLPAAGIIFYFSFGINHRKRKINSKKLFRDKVFEKKIIEEIQKSSKHNFEQGGITIQPYKELAYMLAKNNNSALTANNSVTLLVNGENKFPEVLRELESAKNHIHIEYYIYEDDEIGRAIEQVLIKKVKEGVAVRFIYDDFGSHAIRRKLVTRLKTAGVNVFPFYKMTFLALGIRLNY